MNRELTIFLTAVQYYTRIPCPQWVGHSQEYLNEASRYFPLIGWIVGGISGGVFCLAQFVFPVPVSILLSMIAGILLTGAFHEDGFADTCDGFGGGWSKEQVLEIMKDSRIGTYGTIGLILILLLKFSLLLSIDTAIIPLVLWAAHSVSRFAVTIFKFNYKYVRENEDSKAKPIAKQLSFENMFIAGIWGVFPLLFLNLPYGFLLLAPVLLAAYLMARYCYQRIGGYTGDCLGATQQLCEITFYLGFIVLATFMEYRA